MRTLVALLAVACLVCTGEAFKQRKRQAEEKYCCLPSKHAVKITSQTVDELPNDEGVIETTKYTSMEYEVVDGYSTYSTNNLEIPGSLTYQLDDKEGHAWYSEDRKCYTSWIHDSTGSSSSHCLPVPYVGMEEVDGVSYSVFRANNVEYGSERSHMVLANLDENDQCRPYVWVISDKHPHSVAQNSTQLTTVTATYEFFDLTAEEYENILSLPPRSAYCPGEYPESSTDSANSADSADSADSTGSTGSESDTSDSSNDEPVIEQASEKKRSHAKSRRGLVRTKWFGV